MRALFVRKKEDLSYCLPAKSEDVVDRMSFIQEDDILWLGKGDGWTIFGQCEDPNIEEDKMIPSPAVTLMHNTAKAEGVRGQIP